MMYHLEDKRIPIGELILQLLSSLRTLDGRIEELASGVRNNFYNEAGIAATKERVKALTDTRYKLILTLQDLKLSFNQSYGTELDLATTYLQNLHRTHKI
jgi:hypothetical protein